MKCGDYNLRKGTKVKVFSGDKKQYLGIWEYCGAEVCGHTLSLPRRRSYSPKFKQGRRRIRGYQCWWIPLNVAKKIEEKFTETEKLIVKHSIE